MTNLRVPVATYRLQFNHQFTFAQAIELVDYLNELGITDLYVSPIMKSQPGSMHGYDVLDTNQINPEIGTEEQLGQLVDQLKKYHMGFLIDIIPNHMCIASSANKWWNDVLENGPSSLFANHFNIVWDPPKTELRNKVLLPVLDQQFGKVIENQDLKLIYEEGSFFIDLKERLFPVNPRSWTLILEPIVKKFESQQEEPQPEILELQSILTALSHLPGTSETDPEKCKERNREKEIIKKRLAALLENQTILKVVQEEIKEINGIKGDSHSFDRLEELIKAQPYRLSFWRVTNEEINYRRFFDINDLASMRVEQEEVFSDMHELVLKLVKQKWITGFRIDHVDGLLAPQQYFIRLQKACADALEEQFSETQRNFYMIVEKILGSNEKLSTQWLVFGTTGYDYLNLLNGLFVVTENQDAIRHIYEEFVGQRNSMQNIIYQCKKLILIVSMSSELHILARQLEEVSEQHRWSRDFTLESLRFALREVIACFPVYRSYIRPQTHQISEEDCDYVATAIRNAKNRNPAMESSIFDFIQSVLLLQNPEGLTEIQIEARYQFILRFQQLTGPVTAKGVEDTAFYRYYPLASLNEVGMDPNLFGVTPEYFHQKNQERKDNWPYTMLATSTHDTKRNEDVRARINILSEDPQGWKNALQQWKEYNQDKKRKVNDQEVPDANEEYLLYQTLIGTWPLYPMDAAARIRYIDRIDKFMNKAIKEAKTHTSWVNVNEVYEQGVKEFIYDILTPSASNQFLRDFVIYVQPIIKAGMFNSLSQILLKMTTPGIPDFYQGTELWEFALVDPDNRHSVDYENRSHLLKELKEKGKENQMALIDQLLETPEDGLIKLYMTSQVLNFRRQQTNLFLNGSYKPISINGEKARYVIAFGRENDQEKMIVVVGRFYTQLINILSNPPLGQDIWKDTYLSLTPEWHGSYQDLFTGQAYSIASSIPVSELFFKLPMTLLKTSK